MMVDIQLNVLYVIAILNKEITIVYHVKRS